MKKTAWHTFPLYFVIFLTAYLTLITNYFSFFQPIYRIEYEPLIENDGPETLSSNFNIKTSTSNEAGSSHPKHLDETDAADAISLIKHYANQMGTEIYKQRFTFKDTNFVRVILFTFAIFLTSIC